MKILMNAGAMANLIPEWVVEKTAAPVNPARSLSVKGFDDSVTTMKGYCRLIVTVAGVPTSVLAWVLPGTRTIYILLLSRGWMVTANLIVIYANNIYWITDPETSKPKPIEQMQNLWWTPKNKGEKAPEVMLNAKVHTSEAASQGLRNSAKAVKIVDQTRDQPTSRHDIPPYLGNPFLCCGRESCRLFSAF